MTERPQLGEWCDFSAFVTRHRLDRESYARRRKGWRVPFYSKPGRGMFIGYRTVADGISEWIGEEEGYGFIPESHREVWLFVTDARRKPVYVFPEHVAAKTEGAK